MGFRMYRSTDHSPGINFRDHRQEHPADPAFSKLLPGRQQLLPHYDSSVYRGEQVRMQ